MGFILKRHTFNGLGYCLTKVPIPHVIELNPAQVSTTNLCDVEPLAVIIGRPQSNYSREVVLGLLLHAAKLELRLNTVHLVFVDSCASNLMRQRSKDCIFECVRMLVENNLRAILKFNLLPATDVAINGVQVSMHIELGEA